VREVGILNYELEEGGQFRMLHSSDIFAPTFFVFRF